MVGDIDTAALCKTRKKLHPSFRRRTRILGSDPKQIRGHNVDPVPGAGEKPPAEERKSARACESYGHVSVVGRRREMEDAVAVAPALADGSYDFFGVYDGHGGARVAEACRERMHLVLEIGRAHV